MVGVDTNEAQAEVAVIVAPAFTVLLKVVKRCEAVGHDTCAVDQDTLEVGIGKAFTQES